MSDLVQRARFLAYKLHGGQVDKAGASYYEHVARVAESVSDCEDAQIVAYLHDYLEDGGNWRDIAWLPHELFKAVACLTRDYYDGPEAYYGDILKNPLALRVKLADIADNSNESRLALLDPKTADRLRRKYKHALEMLGQPPTN